MGKECVQLINETGVLYDNHVDDVIRMVTKALEEKDVKIWINVVYSEDDLTNELEERWFCGYIVNQDVKKISLKLNSCEKENQTYFVNCRLEVEYFHFDNFIEFHLYTIEFIEHLHQYCITWIEKRHQIPDQCKNIHDKFECKDIYHCSKKAWWDDSELISLAKRFSDTDNISSYARCISRSIRFRTSNPMIECISIMSNIMSERVNLLYQQIKTDSLENLLFTVYVAASELFNLSIKRNDRNNEWSSKFHAPWYGFDEISYMNKENSKIVCSCFCYMSFIYAILILGGFKSEDIIQFRINNQDLLLIHVNEDIYLLSTDNLVKLNKRTIFHISEINIMFTALNYWTKHGENNLNECKRNYLKQFVCSNSIFHFDFINDSGNSYISKCERAIPIDDSLLSNSKKILNYVFKQSIEEPESIFTYSKYAYQTLFVQKPQAYAAWSLQNNIIYEKAKKMKSLDEINRYMKQLKNESIFIESMRIMTSDQVIRNNCGDEKAKALIFYAFSNLILHEKGGVLLTTADSYCVCMNQQANRYWSARKGNFVNNIEGKTLLAFNERACYYPLIDKNFAFIEDDFVKSILN